MTQRRLPRYLREDSQRADSAPVNWVEYRRLVQPFEEAARFLRAGDSAGQPRAVAYLVEQPRFFGSGYLFEELAAAVATGFRAGPMVADIRKVVLVQARLPIRRETRYVVRLAARYWDEALATDLMGIQREAARQILERSPGVRKSYQGLGLVPTGE